MPKLAIITINLNNSKGLKNTITSVINQTFTDYEYIIIDGGSNDGSVYVIKEFANKITYWVSEPDRGQSHAINKGFALSTGVLLGWLNSDDNLSAGALKAVAERYLNDTTVGAIVGAD